AGQLLGLLSGCGVHGYGRFFELGLKPRWTHEFQAALLRCWKEHVETLDRSGPAPFLEPLEDPLGVVFVVERSNMVRPRAETLHIALYVGRLRERPVGLLPAGGRDLGRPRHGTRDSDKGERQENLLPHGASFFFRSRNYTPAPDRFGGRLPRCQA